MDHSAAFILIVFLTSLGATFVSSMSGGGSAMVTIPVYLWLGISFPIASLMQRFCSCFWVLPASRNYLKGRKIDWKLLGVFVALGMVGAVLGSIAITHVNQNIVKPIIGVLIICLVILMLAYKNLGTLDREHEVSPLRKKLFYATSPLLGFYESFFGSGNGIIFSTLCIKLRGTDLTKALGYYYFVSFFWSLTTVVVLVRSGYTNLPLMIAATLGGVLGGYFGSKLGRLKGNTFVKYAFIIVGTILGLKLLIGF